MELIAAHRLTRSLRTLKIGRVVNKCVRTFVVNTENLSNWQSKQEIISNL